MHTPIAIDNLRDAKIDCHRHECNRFILSEGLSGHQKSARLSMFA